VNQSKTGTFFWEQEVKGRGNGRCRAFLIKANQSDQGKTGALFGEQEGEWSRKDRPDQGESN